MKGIAQERAAYNARSSPNEMLVNSAMTSHDT
jgi:hypothetical protein